MKKILLIPLLFLSYFSKSENNILKEINGLSDSTQLRILVEISDTCDNILIPKYVNPAIKIGAEVVKKYDDPFLKSLYAAAYNNQAYYFDQIGDIKNAVKSYLKALRIREQNKDSIGVGESYNNLGYMFQHQGDLETANDYYHKAKTIFEKLKYDRGLVNVFINMGYNYYLREDYDSSQIYFEKGLTLSEKINDLTGVSYALNNLASIYNRRGDKEKTEQSYLRSLEIREQLGNKDAVARSNHNLGRFYFNQKQIDKSLPYALKNLQLAKELQSPDIIADATILLSDIYFEKKEFAKAYEYLITHVEMKDSILSTETQKATIQQQAKYEYEKQKAIDDKEHEKQLAISAEQEKKQRVIIYATVGGLVLVIIFSIIIFNRLRVTRKQKQVIEEQKKEVVQQKEIIEQAHEEITDSIAYAKRIQNAILPQDKLLKEQLPNSFVLYLPKDIVAGDFYWMEKLDSVESGVMSDENPTLKTQHSQLILFAAADCTGHGVPGAMVSVVCNNGLNRSVREFGLTDPGKILDKTREIVVEEFEKSQDEVKDGMDIALCSLKYKVESKKLPNTQNSLSETVATLQYAGAHNPLWIVRTITSSIDEESVTRGEALEQHLLLTTDNYLLYEIKADKQPIGKFDNPKPYKTHNIELQKNDTIYIFSDGFADQFGGPKGKKMMNKGFRNLLLSIQNRNIVEHKEILKSEFEKWKGDLEQLDDVCVIGVRI